LTRLIGPIWVWLAFNGIIWVWHWPAAYNAALRSDVIHDLEHLTFFGGALLFWWQVIAVGPRLHGRFSRGARIGYLLATTPSNVLLDMLIALADRPIYSYYLTVPRLWGLTVMQDQMLGGAIMWVPGSMMYIVAAVILLVRLLREGESSSLPGNDQADQDTPSLNARQV
jgi:cytochrome c oxidase assembly factor CtaG